MDAEAEQLCFECAARNGVSADDAEHCDDGDVGCPDCPFARNEQPGIEQDEIEF